MSEWKEYKLGEVCDVRDGTHDSPKQSNFGKPLVTSKNIKQGRIELSNTYLVSEDDYNSINKRSKVDKWDVLFSMIGTVGESAIVRSEPDYAIKNVGLFKTGGDERLAKWVYYYLKSNQALAEIDANLKGSTQQYISLGDLRKFPIEIPENDTVDNIINILSSLDDKIDLLNRQNKTLEGMAEALFRKWFVEEESVNMGRLGDYISETVGGEWGKENAEADFSKIVYCLRGTDVADLNYGIPNKTPLRFVKEVKFKKIEPQNGDIIIEISGGTENQSTGRCTYMNPVVSELFDYPLVFSNFCRLLRIKKPEYSYFVYSYLQYLYNQDEFFNLENGSSGIKNLDYKALLFELEFPMPADVNEILNFNDQVQSYFEKINRNKQQMKTLIKLRDTLLPKLMNNEVRV